MKNRTGQWSQTATVFACLVSAAIAAPPAPPGGSHWEQTFADEFSGTTLDRNKWDPYYTWGGVAQIPYHNYDGYCVPEYVILEDGILRLKATPRRPEDTHDATYTTAVIDNGAHFKQRYGYFEGRFRIPRGWSEGWPFSPVSNGLWPAFWTCHGSDWPATGEIDIFEFFGKNKEFSATVHWDEGGDMMQQKAMVEPAPGSYTGEFHTYACDWRSDRVDFYLDDKLFFTSSHPPQDDHYVIINFGIGGLDWLGDPAQNTYPLYFECDWVRVWELRSGDVTGTAGRAGAVHQGFDARIESGGTLRIESSTPFGPGARATIYDARGRQIAAGELPPSCRTARMGIARSGPDACVVSIRNRDGESASTFIAR